MTAIELRGPYPGTPSSSNGTSASSYERRRSTAGTATANAKRTTVAEPLLSEPLLVCTMVREALQIGGAVDSRHRQRARTETGSLGLLRRAGSLMRAVEYSAQ